MKNEIFALVTVILVLGSLGVGYFAGVRNAQTSTKSLTKSTTETIFVTVTLIVPTTETTSTTITLNKSLALTPSPATVGMVMTLTGTGLPANTQLYLTDCASDITYAQFTSNSSGNVPPGVTFTVSPMANPGPETGGLIAWQVDNGEGCGRGPNPVGVVEFLYAASMTLSSAGAPPGATITAAANGLVAGGVYDIIFNYTTVVSNPDAYEGDIVGNITANALGQGIANLTIPVNAEAGTYVIGLVSTHNVAGMNPAYASVLIVPPVLINGGDSGATVAAVAAEGH